MMHTFVTVYVLLFLCGYYEITGAEMAPIEVQSQRKSGGFPVHCPRSSSWCDEICVNNGAVRGQCQGHLCVCLPKFYGSQMGCPDEWLWCETTCRQQGFTFGRCTRFGKCSCILQDVFGNNRPYKLE